MIWRGMTRPACSGWRAMNEGAASQVLAVSRSGTGSVAPKVLGASDDVSSVGVARGHWRRLLVGAGVDLIETTPDGTSVQRIPLDAVRRGCRRRGASGWGEHRRVRRADAPSGPTFSILKVEAGLSGLHSLTGPGSRIICSQELLACAS